VAPPLEDDRGTSLQGEPESGAGAASKAPVSAEYVAAAYGEALLELARREPRLVVLDADLASDCRVRAFELAEPDRFVQNGIAEQDMVSMAAGMARHGLVPIVNSFASFLASRANEQIYNQASERTKVVYAMHYAGLIPAGPGKSHQSLRDASLMAAIPGVTVVHPCNAEETRAIVEWAVLDADESVAIRLAIGPSPRRIELPEGYSPAAGVGVTLREGADALLVSYGPVMLHEALTAAELLAERGIEAAVVAMPWLDRVDADWLAATFTGVREVLVVEDHAPVGALGDTLRRAVAALPEPPAIQVAGVEGWPACGTPVEALRHHGLDGASLAERVALAVPGRAGT
jgi:transketolase